jgi:hypothetical protein
MAHGMTDRQPAIKKTVWITVCRSEAVISAQPIERRFQNHSFSIT